MEEGTWCFPENIVSSIRYHHRPMQRKKTVFWLQSISRSMQEEGQKHVYFDIGMKNILEFQISTTSSTSQAISYKMLDRVENIFAAA